MPTDRSDFDADETRLDLFHATPRGTASIAENDMLAVMALVLSPEHVHGMSEETHAALIGTDYNDMRQAVADIDSEVQSIYALPRASKGRSTLTWVAAVFPLIAIVFVLAAAVVAYPDVSWGIVGFTVAAGVVASGVAFRSLWQERRNRRGVRLTLVAEGLLDRIESAPVVPAT